MISNDMSSPDSVEPILQVRHLTSLFNETFNSIEVGLLARLEALGVMQDQVDVILVIKSLVDIGFSRLVVRDVLEGESASGTIRNSHLRSSHRIVYTEDFINQR